MDQNTSSELDVAPQSHHLLHPSRDKIYTTSTIGQDKSADILNTDDASTSSSFTQTSGIRMEPFQPCNKVASHSNWQQEAQLSPRDRAMRRVN